MNEHVAFSDINNGSVNTEGHNQTENDFNYDNKDVLKMVTTKKSNNKSTKKTAIKPSKKFVAVKGYTREVDGERTRVRPYLRRIKGKK